MATTARTFVMGDIHGAYRALRQCFSRSEFDYEKDELIFLGDVTDGWPETRAAIDELLKVRNLVYILGNHDYWTLSWMQHGEAEDIWLSQGGKATVDSYAEGVPPDHMKLLSDAVPYYISDNRLFVHAGIDPKLPLEEQDAQIFLWDRTLVRTALYLHSRDINAHITKFDEVYVGHTPVAGGKPIHACELWLMDTGAGWSGVLSMMNIGTKEVFFSDPVPELYPGVAGRRRIG